MKLISCYYPNFQISSSWEIPNHLRDILHEVWQRHYEELYDEEADSTTSLEDSVAEVLDVIWHEDDILGHARFVLMALILALAVKPTVEAYLPDDTRTKNILMLLNNWLNPVTKLAKEEFLVSDINNQLFPKNSVGSQAIDEALDVFRNAVRVIDKTQAKAALLEMLDDCFEGYAIFPGSQGRRDLFNWWLLEVVPATWCLEFPKVVYRMKGLEDLKETLFIKFNHYLS